MIPLCVDLDGTLVKGDTLWLSMREIIRANPLHALGIAWKFLSCGRAGMKEWMAGKFLPAPDTLPYHPDVIDWVKQEQASGRHLILVTGAHQRVAEPIAAYIGLFEEVMGTQNGYNMSGGPKADALLKRYGEKGYDYAGNSRVDLPVWQHAHHAIVVNASSKVAHRARALGNVDREFSRPMKLSSGLDR
ncbi:MAG: haloacid dehalogenase-like hydrolase [Verrucomicrobiota bacterium]